MASGVFSRIPNKREFLGRGAAALGFVRALERLGRARGPALLTLIYHRIAEPIGDPYYEPVVSATPDGFRAQMRMIRDRYRVLKLGEVPCAGGLDALGGPAVLVTFDDGYRDNFDAAAPILNELKIPATFFLTADFIQRRRIPWWDHVAFVVKRTAERRLTLDQGLRGGPSGSGSNPGARPEPTPAPDRLTVDLGDGSPPARAAAVRAVVAAFLEGRVGDEARFLAQLDDRAKVAVDPQALGRPLFMTEDQARALAESDDLFDVGSHAVSHRRLAALSEDEQAAELHGSKRILEAAVGRTIDSVAYPFGGADAFDARTERIAAAAGYRLGFSAIAPAGRGAPFNPLRIGRLMIGSGDSAALIRARLALTAAAGGSFL